MNYVRLFLLALVLLACSCGQGIPTPRAIPQGEILNDVVALVRLDGSPFCSGSIILEGVLTAAHCVDEDVVIYVSTEYDDRRDRWMNATPTTVLQRSYELDLALLQFPNSTRLPLAQHNAQVGDRIVAVGHPLGVPNVAQYGYVSTEARENEEGARFQFYQLHNAGTVPGMSGGPVFNMFHEVVGVTSFYIGTPHLGGMIPVEAVRAFLESEETCNQHSCSIGSQ